jgi:hypothetical protein
MQNLGVSLAKLRRRADAALGNVASAWRRSGNPRPASTRSQRVRPPFRRKVLFEMLEQRILLSGDPVSGGVVGGTLNANFSELNDNVVITATGATAGGGYNVNIRYSSGAGAQETYNYAGVTAIVVNAAGGDDSISLVSDTPDFAMNVTIVGGEGNDSILIDDTLSMAGRSFSASAETISVLSGGAITGASSVSLMAAGSQSAVLSVLGDISATGAVLLSAEAGATTNLSAFASHSGSSTATVDVAGVGTVVSGSTVAITARNAVNITANVSAALAGGVTVTQTNITRASVAGGASVLTTGAGDTPVIAGSNNSRLLIRAVDVSSVNIQIDSSVSGDYDFANLFANTTLNRTTTAEVVAASIASAGRVAVEARNSGGIAGKATAGLIGSVANVASDTATARLQDASAGSSSARLGGLSVSALNSAAYIAEGKLASNTVSGATSASVSDSSVFSVGTRGVSVSALNQASLAATSTETSLDLGLDGLTSDLAIGLAYARNTLDSDTLAYIDDSSDISSRRGDISVSATRAAQLTATGEATSVATTGALPGSISVSLGGLLAENRLLGEVEASIEDSSATTDGVSGSVNVNARDSSQVSATTALSATTDGDGLLGPTGVAAGVSIALNSIGWELPSTALATVNLVLGTGFDETETPQSVRAFIRNGDVTAVDDVNVTALSTAQISASVSDETDSSTTSLLGASSGAASAVFAGNKLSSMTRAFIDQGSDVAAGGILNLSAGDSAGISATGSLLSTAGSTSDLGTGAGVNLSDSSAIGIGGMVVRNDVRGGAESYIDNALVAVAGAVDVRYDVASAASAVALAGGDRVRAGDGRVFVYLGANEAAAALASEDFSDASRWAQLAALQLRAHENATIVAHIESTVSASGGSAWGSGTVIAVGGTIAVNLIQSKANAWIKDSDVSTASSAFGDIALDARNTSVIDATVMSAANSGDTAGAVTLAFNTLGWESQDLLTQGLDALLGNPLAQDVFGLENAAEVQAYILDSQVDAAADLSLQAGSQSIINATVSNAADSTASAFYGATGGSMGGVLASNKVSSVAKAFIEFSASGAAGNLVVDGELSVQASDEAGIYANSKVVASSMTTNNGGASNLVSAVLSQVATTNESGTLTLDFGDLVRLESDFGAEDFGSADGEQDLEQDVTLVRVADDYVTPRYTTEFGSRQIFNGDVIEVAEGYAGTSGAEGSFYRYIGTASALLDLGDQDFEDTDLWIEIGGSAGAVYRYIGADASGVDLNLQDYSDAGLWQELGGSPGRVYEFMGQDGSVLDLANQNYGDVGFWKIVPTDDLVPQGINFSDSDSAGIALMVVYNEVRSAVEAYARNIVLDVGGSADAPAIAIGAIESATIRAVADNSATSSGGSSFGSGSSLAANGTLATNVVLSAADAFIENGQVVIGAGDLVITAENRSLIDAITKSLAASGEDSVGILLAFNTIGFVPQNLFFNTFDALLGISETAPDYTTSDTAVATINVGDRVQDSVTGTIYKYNPDLSLQSAPSALVLSDTDNWEVVTPYASNDDATYEMRQFDLISGVVSGNLYRFELPYSQEIAPNDIPALDDAIGWEIVVPYDSTSTTVVTLKPGDLVKDVATGTLYRYSPELSSLVVAPSAISDFGDSSVWTEEEPLFNAEQPARVQAYLLNTTVDAAGEIALSAVSAAQINSRVSNEATSYPAAFFGAAGSSTSGVLSSSKVSGAARAFIDFDYGFTQASGPSEIAQITAGDRVKLDSGDIYEYLGSAVLSSLGNASQNYASNSANWRLVNTVVADGGLSISAEDRSGVSAETGLYATVEPVNDAGSGLINGFVNALLDDYQYTTESGSKQLKFGDRVMVGSNHDSAKGDAGSVYQYMGESLASGVTADLADQDYSDAELWKPLSENNLITDSLVWAGLTAIGTALGKDGLTGEAKSYYAMVDRNDVQSVVESFIDNATVTAGGDVALSAVAGATIVAFDDSVVTSWDGGGGVIVTNQVRSASNAFIVNSRVETSAGSSGDVRLDASNVSTIDATISSITEMWGSSTSVLAAFNSVGWDGGNLLFQAVDALLGTSILGDENPAETQAYIRDSRIDADGDIDLSAVNLAQINASLVNESSAEAAIDLFFAATKPAEEDCKDDENLVAESQAVGGLLATNRVSSLARAFIEVSAGREAMNTIDAGGAISIVASDSAGIAADMTVVSMASSTNDLSGLVGIYEALFLPNDYEYTTLSGTVTVNPGDQVRIGDDRTGSGDVGSIYRYDGAASALIDLKAADYNLEDGPWTKLTGGTSDPSDLYPNIGNLADSNSKAYGGLVALNDVRSDVLAYIDNADVTAQAQIEADHVAATAGSVALEAGARVLAADGKVYAFLPESSDGAIDLAAEDYSDSERWARVNAIQITALENATLTVNALSSVSASGGSAWGSGEVIAVNGQIATNLVLSRANAYVVDSVLTTANGGDVALDARNTSILDATITSSLSTGDKGLGITFAFNTIGWKSQNVLFNALDAIIGDPLLAEAFDGEQPAETQAYILDSTLDIDGDLGLSAINEAQLNATVTNAAASAASALFGANGRAGGGALSSNKVSSLASAYIDFTAPGWVQCPGARHGRRRRRSCDLRRRQCRHLLEREDRVLLDHHQRRWRGGAAGDAERFHRGRFPVFRGRTRDRFRPAGAGHR